MASSTIRAFRRKALRGTWAQQQYRAVQRGISRSRYRKTSNGSQQHKEPRP